MKKQDLAAKTMAELRALAKERGITAVRTWKKEDFIKALSPKKPAAKKPAKAAHKAKPLKKKVSAAAKPPQKGAPSKAAKKPEKKPEKKIEKKAVKTTATKTAQKAGKKKPAPKAAPKPAPKGAKKPAPSALRIKRKKSPPPAAHKPLKALAELTVAELKALARELAVPLKPGSRKADIIKALSVAKRVSAPKKAAVEKPAPPVRKKTVAPKAKKAAPLRKKVKAAAVAKAPARKKQAVAKRPAAKKPLFKEIPKLMEKPKEPLPPAPLPGEDKIVTMTVSPRRLYVYWEVAEATIARHPGNLNLKVSDLKSGEAFYLPIDERIGEYFVTVHADAEYTAEVGVIDRSGTFVNMIPQQKARPFVAVTPPETVAEPPRRKAPVKAAREPEPQLPRSVPPFPEGGPVRQKETGAPAVITEGAWAEVLAAVGETVRIPAEEASFPEAAHPAPAEEPMVIEGLPEEFFILPESVSSY